jgi:hypothetical protein
MRAFSDPRTISSFGLVSTAGQIGLIASPDYREKPKYRTEFLALGYPVDS